MLCWEKHSQTQGANSRGGASRTVGDRRTGGGGGVGGGGGGLHARMISPVTSVGLLGYN